MSLIICPECGKKISDLAEKCINCGCSLNKTAIAENESLKSDNIGLPKESVEVSKKSIKLPKWFKLALTIGLGILLCLAIVIAIVSNNMIIGDISISKWRLTDTTDYADYYEGRVESERAEPFIAVIGEKTSYTDEAVVSDLVYVKNGVGMINVSEEKNGEPYEKYGVIGYINGNTVDETDVSFTYTETDYNDYDFIKETNCNVIIDIKLNSPKTGILLFDIIDETNNNTINNHYIAVVEGNARYTYYASLPYKSRGVDISFVPKFFCESKSVKNSDFIIKNPYNTTENKDEYSTYYFCSESFILKKYNDGLIIYTYELVEGGEKEKIGLIENEFVYLEDEECELFAFDIYDSEENIEMPKYEFNIIGYLKWNLLK